MAPGAAQQRPHRVQKLVQRAARARVVVSQQPARDVWEALLWRNHILVSTTRPMQTGSRASPVLLRDTLRGTKPPVCARHSTLTTQDIHHNYYILKSAVNEMQTATGVHILEQGRAFTMEYEGSTRSAMPSMTENARRMSAK